MRPTNSFSTGRTPVAIGWHFDRFWPRISRVAPLLSLDGRGSTFVERSQTVKSVDVGHDGWGGTRPIIKGLRRRLPSRAAMNPESEVWGVQNPPRRTQTHRESGRRRFGGRGRGDGDNQP